MYSYENDPYKDESFWPDGYGVLSNVCLYSFENMKIILNSFVKYSQAGKLRQYQLGQYLRKRYETLIGAEYSPNDVYIRSSDTDRTLMSAEANLAGLFPPSGEQVWKTSLKWQPIPIHTIPIDEDYLVYQSLPCPRGDKELKEYFESPAIRTVSRKYRKFLEFLERNSGTPIRSIKDAAIFHDPLLIESFRGLR